MVTVLLVLIYLAFISLGLPDSLLGSAWPVMHQSFGVVVSAAGIESMIVSFGTICSSFFSERLIRRFGTAKVTIVSVFLTAISLIGTYFAPGFFWICILAIPLGLGAGAIDSALNNFVALHYKAKHMSWLHCFWGIGASASPIIMSYFLASSGGWRMGYLSVGIIQAILFIILLGSIPCWKKFERETKTAKEEHSTIKLSKLIQIPGAKATLISFFGYCAVELTVGLWGSTYLVNCKDISADMAAKWVSLYYIGITVGRLLTGFFTMRLSNRCLIRIGQVMSGMGILMIFLPLPHTVLVISFMCIGLGFAPIFPCMLHETPNRFGKELSQSIMGIQMACAYVGSTFMPPLFGKLGQMFGMQLFPYFVCALIVLMVVSSEHINAITNEN